MHENSSEYRPPIHFAGRERELHLLDDHLETAKMLNGSRQGVLLVTGGPGIGKTELTTQFAATCKSPAIKCSVSDFENPRDLFLMIGRCIGKPEEFHDIANARYKGKRRETELHNPSEKRQSRSSGDLDYMLKASSDAGLWNPDMSSQSDSSAKSLVVTVDDLHTMNEDQVVAFRDLHEGLHECSILLIGAGLKHTKKVLNNLNIRLIAEGVTLDTLHHEATAEIIEESLVAKNRTPPRTAIEELTTATQGHPQHIQTYLATCDRIVDEKRGWRDTPALSRQIIAEGQQDCAQWCDSVLDRMGDAQHHLLPLVQEMRQKGVTKMPQGVAVGIIHETGRDGRKTIADAIKHGIMSADPYEGGISFDVPSSLHSRLIERLDEREISLRETTDERVSRRSGR